MALMKAIFCYSCGVEFHIAEAFNSDLVKSKRSFYCPNGHSQAYCENEADKLRREKDRLTQQLAQKDDEIKWQRDHRLEAERKVVAAKGQITKLKKRAKAGVCPCCNRTFSDMAAHMKTKHPDMDPNVVDLGAEKAKRAS